MSPKGAARPAPARSGAGVPRLGHAQDDVASQALADSLAVDLSYCVVQLASLQPDIEGARLWKLSGNRTTLWQESGKLPPPAAGISEKQFSTRAATKANATSWSWPVGENDQIVGILEVFGSRPLTERTRSFLGIFSRVAGLALFGEERLQDFEELQTIVEATKRLNSTLDLGELINIILQLAARMVNADRGTVFLLDSKRNEIWSLVGLGLDQHEIRLPISRGIAGWVAGHGETVNLENAHDDPRFESEVDRRTGYHTRNLVCLPIRNEAGEVGGVLELLNKKGGSFTAADERALSHLSVHVAVALEKARLHREALLKQRMEHDLELARSVQQGLMPEHVPQAQGFEFGVLHIPSQMVGGDYYDFVTLDPQTMLTVVADVEGKGVASALVAATIQATLRALSAHVHALQNIVSSVNRILLADTRAKKFSSMFVGLLDKRNRALHYINGGHVPPAVIRADGETVYLTEGGTLVGLFPNVTYERGFLRLHTGDVVVSYSDGITEATDIHGRQFGLPRLVAVAKAERDKSAQSIAESVMAEVDRYSSGGTIDDDRMVVVLKVL
ncbi:MAG TPA: GAF domain-containing SpoIIE family protein phosphatase [Terriglobales bacterium]|nr:GAF domain-containing SpoIIE family protein phosphatase [Terriglobales bacterium]